MTSAVALMIHDNKAYNAIMTFDLKGLYFLWLEMASVCDLQRKEKISMNETILLKIPKASKRHPKGISQIQTNKYSSCIKRSLFFFMKGLGYAQLTTHISVDSYIPYARHYNPRFVYFLPYFYIEVRFILQTTY